MAVRAIAMIVGLGILAGVWTILTYVVWLFLALFAQIGRMESAIVIATGLLSYGYTAALLLGPVRAKRTGA